ncbi:hypothetical protein MIZ01_2324 [Sideroxyarcus emersonii]|uniref:YecA family protein n=1 Tax=Sideroxyarcus emersonii TaxID=2764705 RepID=A0AAN1XBM2_9PROT|nr:UPF0149 family protein [Sideroxyarcus emersonii]BCK88520.1 hypothetical protein MIZ01_2324 [Sideroxyarcus emersonii]
MPKQESFEEEEVTPALSEEEMDELDSFLMSDATTNEVMLLDCLDGFLTALASGPAMPKPEVWMPRIWGPTTADTPAFASDAQAARITDLLTRHLNAIVWSLQQDAEHFEPVFDLQVYEGDEHEYMDGEMWAHGFMTGIDMQRDKWKALFESRHGPVALRPIYLLGAAEITEAEEALVQTPAQREELSRQIPASIGWVYKFWAPQRRAADSARGKTADNETQKISRNAPCPCGSGRKYKKCCGATRVED